jgi:hypothetical protein
MQRAKTAILVAAFLACLAGSTAAEAGVIAVEDFESYAVSGSTEQWAVDNPTTPPGPTGGSGWSGAWNVDQDTALDSYTPPLGLFVRSGGMDYTGGTVSVDGGEKRLEFLSRTSGVSQIFITRQLPAQNDTVYLGFTFRGHNIDDDFLQVGFDDTGAIEDEEVYIASVVFTGGEIRSRAGRATGGQQIKAADYADDTLYQLVLKLWKSSGNTADNYDRVTLWVDPTSTVESGGTTAASNTGYAAVDYFNIRRYNIDTGNAFEIDNLRIADTYAEALVPEPATLALLALGAGALAARRRRR